MKLFTCAFLLFQTKELEPGPCTISRYLYAKNYGPTVGDKVISFPLIFNFFSKNGKTKIPYVKSLRHSKL